MTRHVFFDIWKEIEKEGGEVLKRVFLALSFFAFVFSGCSHLADRPKISADPLRKIVVFHSYWGNTRFVAGAIAEAIGADLVELKTREELRLEGWKPYLGSREIGLESKPELTPIQPDPREYDVVFIGTPVWNGRHTMVLNSFFEAYPLQGKKVALFCTFANNAGGVFGDMREHLGGNEVIGEYAFKNPLRNRDQTARQASEWARSVLSE
jgi:flavodoxin